MRAMTCLFIALFGLGSLLLPTSTSAGNSSKQIHLAIVATQGKNQLKRYKEYLEKTHNMKVTWIEANRSNKDSEFIGDLSQLEKCDVILSNIYRTWAPPEQLKQLKKAFLSKPVVGLRKAHHGFQNWQEADKEVFGVDYRGHYGNSKNSFLEVTKKHTNHPAFKKLKVTIPGGGCYGHTDLADDLEVYMIGGQKGKEPHPQTWSRIVKNRGNQRVFYTRYDPENLEDNETVRDMVTHMIYWAADRKSK